MARDRFPLFIVLVLAAAALTTGAAPPGGAHKPEDIYRTTCATCHGAEGCAPQKGEGLSFADGEWNHGSDLKSVTAVITDGVPETGMLPFKDTLSAADIVALAKYVRSLDKHLKP